MYIYKQPARRVNLGTRSMGSMNVYSEAKPVLVLVVVGTWQHIFVLVGVSDCLSSLPCDGRRLGLLGRQDPWWSRHGDSNALQAPAAASIQPPTSAGLFSTFRPI